MKMSVDIFAIARLRKKYNNQYISGKISQVEYDHYMSCLLEILDMMTIVD